MAFQESLRGREVNEVRSISEERAPVFNRLIDENNRRFKEEILPLYREMVNKFAGNLGLAALVKKVVFEGRLIEPPQSEIETWR